jgi:hypothetical protein
MNPMGAALWSLAWFLGGIACVVSVCELYRMGGEDAAKR